MIVADESAVFGLPEVSVGLVPGGGGTQLAQRRLGPGRAADLVLTGRRLLIDEAVALGLVDRRVPVEARPGVAAPAQGLGGATQNAKKSPGAARAAQRAFAGGAGGARPAGGAGPDPARRAHPVSA